MNRRRFPKHPSPTPSSGSPPPNPNSATAPAPVSPLTNLHQALGSVLTGLFVLASLSLRPKDVRDPDVFWHLATGREIWNQHSPLFTDPFAYPTHLQAWANHEWLYQILLWLIHSSLGPGGVLMMVWLGMTLAFQLARMAAHQIQLSPPATAMAAILAVLASLPFSQARPTALSLIPAAALLLCAHAAIKNLDRLPWPKSLFSPFALTCYGLLVLWANLHATFLLGLVVLALLGIGAILDQIRQSQPSPQILALALRGLGFFTLACGATLLNPHGYAVHLIPFQVAGSGFFRSVNQEWRPPDLSWEFSPFYLALPFLLLGLRDLSKRSPGLLLVAISLTILSFTSRRLIVWWSILALPLLASGFSVLPAALQCLGSLLKLPPSLGKPALIGSVTLLILFQTLCLYRTVTLPSAPIIPVAGGFLAQANLYPVSMALTLPTLSPSGRVFNDYNHGGYLHKTIGPPWKVAMDGRNELFGEDRLRHYEGILSGKLPFKETLEKDQVDAALLSWDQIAGNRQLLDSLIADPDWMLLGWDDASILFVRRNSPAGKNAGPWEIREMHPLESPASALQRATSRERQAILRDELEDLAKRAPSRRTFLTLARLSAAMGDQATALLHFEAGKLRTLPQDPLLILTRQELGLP